MLRGSFLLTPADSAEITVWLAHNNVGAEFAEGDTEKLIHTNVITATTHSCTNVDEKENQPGVEGDVHGYEAKTCEVTPVTISAAPRYNVALEIAYPSTSSKKGTFDFSMGLLGQVPNYIAADENEKDDLYVSNPVDSNPETERPVDVQYPGCYIIPYNFMLSPGYTCVGAMLQFREVITDLSNQYILALDGLPRSTTRRPEPSRFIWRM